MDLARSRWLIAGCVFAFLHACGTAVEASKSEPDGAIVGTYDGRAVVIAYAGSDSFRELMAALRSEHEDALARGDQEQADALEKKAIAQQERFHGQAFRGDDIDDILDRFADQVAAICKATGVTRIEKVNQDRPEAQQAVDVTDQIVQLFDPDERAKKWIADIRGQPFPK
jgi:hypothetical protein